MLSKKMLDALNAHMDKEFLSSFQYLAMSAHFEDKNLDGMAKWMRVQAAEEYGHAMKFFQYIVEQDGRVTLGGVAKPKGEWKSPQTVFSEAHKNEQHVTKLINDLMDLARAENDKATEIFLQWFITEQVEDEKITRTAKEKMEMAGDNVSALFALDREFGARAGG